MGREGGNNCQSDFIGTNDIRGAVISLSDQLEPFAFERVLINKDRNAALGREVRFRLDGSQKILTDMPANKATSFSFDFLCG